MYTCIPLHCVPPITRECRTPTKPRYIDEGVFVTPLTICRPTTASVLQRYTPTMIYVYIA